MNSSFLRISRKLFLSFVSIVVFSGTIALPVSAYDKDFYSSNNILFFNPDASTCVSGSLINNGRDYKGREILSSAQNEQITKNRSVYEEAANSAGIPWQIIAILHLRETGLKLTNPENGQGLYQEFAAAGTDKYPPGDVSQESFLEQSKWAAEFIKGKTSLSLISGDTAAVKDAFFGYNGRASAYTTQARALGFNEGYEGSPYVMNKADSRRDPSVLPLGDTSWGQIKQDGGVIEYPANNGYGAYVIYAALTNSSSGGCGITGSSQERIVSIARAELESWNSGAIKADGEGYKKYTNGSEGNWCAWFASWVYYQAGYPLVDGSTGAVPAVSTIQSIGISNQKFAYHEKSSYTPKIGDLVIQKNGVSHVNIIVAIDGTQLTIIGGNQGYGADGVTDFSNSKVTEYSFDYLTNGETTGFVSIKE